MKIDLNKIIGFIIIGTGYGLFFSYVIDNLPIAFISILGMCLIWILWKKMTDSFTLNHLIYLITFSGVIVSLSILSFYGIEPIGTRNGTLMRFHSTNIAFSLALFFLTFIPYIIFNMKMEAPIKKLSFNLKPAFIKKTKQPKPAKQKQDQYIIDDDNWEIASEGDALSGDYHID